MGLCLQTFSAAQKIIESLTLLTGNYIHELVAIREQYELSWEPPTHTFQVHQLIAERVSALDRLSLRYAAIITLPVSNPGLCS